MLSSRERLRLTDMGPIKGVHTREGTPVSEGIPGTTPESTPSVPSSSSPSVSPRSARGVPPLSPLGPPSPLSSLSPLSPLHIAKVSGKDRSKSPRKSSPKKSKGSKIPRSRKGSRSVSPKPPHSRKGSQSGLGKGMIPDVVVKPNYQKFPSVSPDSAQAGGKRKTAKKGRKRKRRSKQQC